MGRKKQNSSNKVNDNLTNTSVSTNNAACYQINAPEPFYFSSNKLEAWPKWRTWFEQFWIAFKLHLCPHDEQVNTMLYLLGESANDIYPSFQFETNTKITYNSMISKFNFYFIPRRNVIYKQVFSNSRCQQTGEPIENFITDLHKLSTNCKYGNLQKELICD